MSNLSISETETTEALEGQLIPDLTKIVNEYGKEMWLVRFECESKIFSRKELAVEYVRDEILDRSEWYGSGAYFKYIPIKFKSCLQNLRKVEKDHYQFDAMVEKEIHALSDEELVRLGFCITDLQEFESVNYSDKTVLNKRKRKQSESNNNKRLKKEDTSK